MTFFFFSCFSKSPILIESTPADLSFDHPHIQDAYMEWPKIFSKAQKSIDIAAFYISPSPKADALDASWEELHKATLRGVQLRILLDKNFSQKYPNPLKELQTWPNTTLRFIEFPKGVMHAKYFIVDNTIAFLGSQNFDYRAMEHIFELGYLCTEKTLVQSLIHVFSADWNTQAYITIPKSEKQHRLYVSPSRTVAEHAQELPHLLHLINTTQKHLSIQLLSYNNKSRSGEHWPVLDNALINAKKRGVHVELMVSDWSTKGSKGEALQMLQKNGINIHIISVPEHPDGPIPYARTIHAKYMISDQNNCWLGTSNWAKGYFLESRNVGVISYDSPICSQLQEIYNDIKNTTMNTSLYIHK